MVVLRRKFAVTAVITAGVLVVLGASPTAAPAQDDPLPISLDADSSSFDRKSNRLIFRSINVQQGDLGIKADEASASKLDFDNSSWKFTGNVDIRSREARIRSNEATLIFNGHELVSAVIIGEPARFEQFAANNNGGIRGEAQTIEYDFENGTVRLEKNAKMSEGGNEITGNVLLYNIEEDRVIAESGTADGERVQITISPANPIRPADSEQD